MYFGIITVYQGFFFFFQISSNFSFFLSKVFYLLILTLGERIKEITFSNDSLEDVRLLQIKAVFSFFIIYLYLLNPVLAPVQIRLTK